MTFTCEECGGTFDAARSDEAAQQEALDAFGVRGDAPGMAVVCDDCYREIMKAVVGTERASCVASILVSEADAAVVRAHLSTFEQEFAARLTRAMEDDLLTMLFGKVDQ